MKKVFFFLAFLSVTPSVFAQKVPIRWVSMKTNRVQDYEVPVSNNYTLWYPQIDSCAGAEKINKWLKENALDWSDFDFKSKMDGDRFEATSKVLVTFNNKGLLSFTHYFARETNINAKDFDNFGVTFDVETGKRLKTNDFINQSALAQSTALQSDDNCFLTKQGLTIPNYGGNQEFSWHDLKPFARKNYRFLFR